MIKITTITAAQKSDTHLVLIPGGPGISSKTIRGFDLLAKKFNLHYVDFPGMNGITYDRDRSFEELSELLLNEVKKIKGNVYLIGHSFGGFFATDAALWFNVSGLICVGTPFSKKSLSSASANYSAKMTSALKNAEIEFEKRPTDETFNKWLAEYGELYFSPQKIAAGKELMLGDLSSARAYLHNTGDSSKMEPMLEKVSELSVRKLFITGKDDGLLNLEDLRSDANRGRFKFSIVNNANHFSMFDQPEQVASLIEDFIATNERE